MRAHPLYPVRAELVLLPLDLPVPTLSRGQHIERQGGAEEKPVKL